jgi:hypothetical protein
MSEKNDFEGLLDEIEGLQKALPVGDDKPTGGKPAEGDEGKTDDAAIAAAAAEGGEGDDEDDKEALGKSFKITLADGTETDAVDGTELVKALINRVETIEANQGLLLKANQGLAALNKSLIADLGALKTKGTGRKAVIAITEKPAAETDLGKSTPTGEGMTGEAFMVKALDAQAAGRITSRHVAECEAFINSGQQPPASIVKAVLA